MFELSEAFTVGVVLMGVWMLGVTRLATSLMFYSAQTLQLAVLAIWSGQQHAEPALIIIGCAFLLLKGLFIPVWLNHVLVRIGCRRDEGLALAPPLLMVLAIGGLAALFLLQPLQTALPLSAMPALDVLLVGMLLMMTRRTAVSQIIGFLVLENGVFLYTVSQAHAIPVMVELGALLDILGWTMMAGVLTFQINDSFEHIDVSAMKELHGMTLATPILAGPILILASLLVLRGVWLTRWIAALAVAHAVVVALVCVPFLLHPGSPAQRAFGFQMDGTAALFLTLTTLVFASSLVHAVGFLARDHGGEPINFYAFATLFLVTMYGVVAADDLGYLWISMEATTLVSAPLVYYHRSKSSLEAAWKYLIICSVAIAFAFFGTALIYSASEKVVALHGGTLFISLLRLHATALSPGLLRVGFVFVLLGYGTKAGLFPLHNWLPDAHSEAPSPASAILSGAMLNCALVPLWRVSGLMADAGDAAFVKATLLPMGVATVIFAALFLLKQTDLKRLLAYSSMENVGLMAVAVSLGASGAFTLQAWNHSLVKVALFLLAGNVLQQFGTKRLDELQGALSHAPVTAALLLAGGVAVAGTPPFGSFLSEWQILVLAAAGGHMVAVVALIVGLAMAFIAICLHLGTLLFGSTPRALPGPAGGLVVPGFLLFGSLLLGVVLTPHLLTLAEGVLR